MDIQNISGSTDVISRDFGINSNVTNESANVQVQETKENPKPADETKGRNVDVLA